MTSVTSVLFDALKVALWGDVPHVDLYRSLSLSDWNNLYEIACKQTVEVLVFDALESLPDDIEIPKDLIKKWCIRVDQIEQRNTYMNQVIKSQIHFFDNLGIKPILQKGQGIAKYYPNPLHRNCGDIDWYINNKNDFDKTFDSVKQHVEKVSRSKMDAFFVWKHQETELHSRLVETRNPLKWSFIKKLEDQHKTKLDFLKLDDITVSLPAPLLNILLVNIHILKHQITYGIGLRQLCDAAVLYDKLYKKYDSNELLLAYKNLGVVQWTHVFHHLLVNYIGLSENKIPYPIKKSANSDWMINDILNSGNFGFTDDRYDDSSSQTGRVNRFGRLGSSYLKYMYYAPEETLIFPFFQGAIKFYKLFNKS